MLKFCAYLFVLILLYSHRFRFGWSLWTRVLQSLPSLVFGLRSYVRTTLSSGKPAAEHAAARRDPPHASRQRAAKSEVRQRERIHQGTTERIQGDAVCFWHSAMLSRRELFFHPEICGKPRHRFHKHSFHTYMSCIIHI